MEIFAPARSQAAASSEIFAKVAEIDKESSRNVRALRSSQIYHRTRRLPEWMREASAQGSPEERLAGFREGSAARTATRAQIRRECGQSMKRCMLVLRFRMQRGQK